jgi:uncharacterized protein YndB with AHSA1/START domain
MVIQNLLTDRSRPRSLFLNQGGKSMRLFLVAAVAVVMLASPARAEVASASPSGFVIQAQATVAASPERVWRAVGQLGRWWNSAHTYSGDARRMQIDLHAGGCWCERWGERQSVEHGRVILAMEHEGVRTLRLDAPLGPLQDMAVNAILTFTVAPDPAGAKITMTYRVSGDPSLSFEQMAPAVDGVLMEQFGRLGRYSASGSPE